jgi:hypothetical protein
VTDDAPDFDAMAAAMNIAEDATALIRAYMDYDAAAQARITSGAISTPLLLSSVAYISAEILRVIPAQLADQALAAGKHELRDFILDEFRRTADETPPDAGAPPSRDGQRSRPPHRPTW